VHQYLNAYDAVWRAKRNGRQAPPKIDQVVRTRIETALAATRIRTVFDSPASSRLWREFEAVCRQLDRAK
jgi:hypothetical protein